MRKILIVNGHLVMGGAEKLVYELAVFARKNNIAPTVLIVDNYVKEYYDPIFKQKKIKVVRTRLSTIRNFRAPLKMLRSMYWSFRLKYFADSVYDSVHVIGLHNIYRAKDFINHSNRFYWHVTNAAQGSYNYPESYFDTPSDTVVCINQYQESELDSHYGNDVFKCKRALFPLFLND
jgi:hypothetical protein